MFEKINLMNKTAVFPGSFSPFTLGHKSIVDRALPLFDKIVISIGINAEKNEYFSIDEREQWIESVYQQNTQVEIKRYEDLTVNFCEKIGAKYILRGLRNSHDFKYEKDIAQTNKNLNPNIETIFIIGPEEFSHISSTIIRDIIRNGGDVSQFLPKEIDI